jgi:hypothetical protein
MRRGLVPREGHIKEECSEQYPVNQDERLIKGNWNVAWVVGERISIPSGNKKIAGSGKQGINPLVLSP